MINETREMIHPNSVCKSAFVISKITSAKLSICPVTVIQRYCKIPVYLCDH